MGFTVGLLEVGACVLGCKGQENGHLDGIVDVDVHELCVCGALDGVDHGFLGFHVCGALRPVV